MFHSMYRTIAKVCTTNLMCAVKSNIVLLCETSPICNRTYSIINKQNSQHCFPNLMDVVSCVVIMEEVLLHIGDVSHVKPLPKDYMINCFVNSVDFDYLWRCTYVLSKCVLT